MKQYIYLDDVRTPTQGVGESDQPWVIVRSYDEFVEKVNEIGLENIQKKLLKLNLTKILQFTQDTQSVKPGKVITLLWLS